MADALCILVELIVPLSPSRTDANDLEEIVDKLFEDGLDEIFVKAGGRNFLLIDVPPEDRSPGGRYTSFSSSSRS